MKPFEIKIGRYQFIFTFNKLSAEPHPFGREYRLEVAKKAAAATWEARRSVKRGSEGTGNHSLGSSEAM